MRKSTNLGSAGLPPQLPSEAVAALGCATPPAEPTSLPCNTCHEVLPLDHFNRNHKHRMRAFRQYTCKACQRVRDKKSAALRLCYAPALYIHLGRPENGAASISQMLLYGRVIKVPACQKCDCEWRRLVGHHEDYVMNHIVVWVCDRCHNWIHRVDKMRMRDEWDMPLAFDRGRMAVDTLRRVSISEDADWIEVDERRTRIRAINVAIAQLPPRQKFVIQCRFGLAGETVLTMKVIGTRLGVTKQCVQQDEARALEAIRTKTRDLASTLPLSISPRPCGRGRSGQALTASPQKTHRQPARSYSKEA